MSSLHQGFRATDQSADTEAIFGWLDRMNGSPLILQVKRQMLEVRPVGEGDQVLDVGCGLGHEVFRLAELVGPQGRVTGIDANSAMITEAHRRAAGLTVPIAFEVGAARIAEVLDAAVPHPWIGRQLFGMFRRAGLRDVRVVPHVICLSGAAGFAVYQQLNRGTIDRARQAGQVTAEEVAAWWAALERAGETEMFFTAVLGFIAAGCKP